ncbi:hypothetical protein B0O80DRAFT_520472 [Mortierella sp. GBAus27b]|nr:hypothetical protein B0O80DRAFT_520472 [Mortierella sp. GBAus27b]
MPQTTTISKATPREDRILQFLQRIAPWIRSLAIHSHHSSRQLRLGNQCTNINTLLIAAPPFNGQFGEDYWSDCEALVQQNSTYLRSLTLVRWGVGYDLPSPRLAPRHPLWTPTTSSTPFLLPLLPLAPSSSSSSLLYISLFLGTSSDSSSIPTDTSFHSYSYKPLSNIPTCSLSLTMLPNSSNRYNSTNTRTCTINNLV